MVDQLALPVAISAFLFPALMIVAGAGDVLSMRIPNWLTVLVAVTFLPLALWAGLPPTVLLIHVATGIVALAGGFLLFSLGLIGGGDAKLLAAGAVWFGFPGILAFLVYTALAGGVLAVAVSLWSALRVEAEVHELDRRGVFRSIMPEVPYGFALAAGAILASPSAGWWMAAGPA
jgi:prepilin peptidase CpaA